MDKFKDYTRFPIITSSHAILVIHVFKRTEYLEDVIWMNDFEPKWQEDVEMYKRAAEQFINQLEGRYCDLFLQELIKVCQEKLKK